MKRSSTKKGIAYILSLAFGAFVLFSISSCARKLTFGVSSVVPAATGTVKIKKTDNENYLIDVKVTNLAPASRLTPSRKVYVVWMESKNDRVKNIGMIKTSSGLFSSTYKGELKASSNEKPATVFITAEDDGDVRYPGNQMVLKTK